MARPLLNLVCPCGTGMMPLEMMNKEFGLANGGKRPIVVVLGMHRSGTSLLTHLLTLLGVDLGGDLLAANVHNEMGYWENESVYRTQNDLMNHIAKDWGDFGFAYPFAIDWQRRPEFQTFQDTLVSIVRAELAKASGLWGFKDPRTCRLLPMWKDIFAQLNLKPHYVLAVRNPAVAVESLLKMYPLDPLHAEWVWLLHNLDAVRDAGQELRLVVDYDRWFTEPREQAQAVAKALDLAWPADDSDLVGRLTRTIRPDLRHANARRPCSLSIVTKTHEALKQAAVSGQAPGPIVSGLFHEADQCLSVAIKNSFGSGKPAAAPVRAEVPAENGELKEKEKRAAELLFNRAAKPVAPPPIVPAPIRIRKERAAFPAAAGAPNGRQINYA
jgi:hypothetical protein